MRKCEITGKIMSRGFKYSIRGIAKKQKGIGLKVTGKTKRRFKINLITKRLWVPEENRFVTMRVSTQALRTIDKNGISATMRKARASGNLV